MPKPLKVPSLARSVHKPLLIGISYLVNHRCLISQIKSPGEALSTFIRASRDPKGETQLRVEKSTKIDLLTPKTKPKHFPNKS